MVKEIKSTPTIPLKLSEYTRILKLTRKPTREEFTMIAKVSGAGILIIGLIGFIIYFFLTEVPKLV
ncbi:MAG: protein translocase SEC61 complex subunit gamma [ANME-2 cluster archaeon]|nr:protein translocase SEC61 complex subunit gamma [ANME-2 cluster archaeon]MDW7777192.1 protein translocase SEC61 complex subunit gamma [Methanosarcinales archaeon]